MNMMHDDTLGTDDPEWGAKTVADLMSGTMPLVSAGTRMTDSIEAMTAGKFGCVGVVDSSGQLMGIITDGDLRRHMDSGMFHSTAADVMTWSPLSFGAQIPVKEALWTLNQRRITVAFVVDKESKPIGIVHLHDLLAAGA